MPTDALLGPAALLVGALIAVGVLWREHTRSDADVRMQRDAALAGWKDQTLATNRLADAIEARARSDAKRTRQTDASPPRRTDV